MSQGTQIEFFFHCDADIKSACLFLGQHQSSLPCVLLFKAVIPSHPSLLRVK